MTADLSLVVGATGLLGMEVVRRLRDSGKRVRAVVRTGTDPAKRAALESTGAELVVADLKLPRSLEEVCHGVTSIVSTASAMLSRHHGDSIQTVDEEGQLSLIEVAIGAKVRHFVYISFPPTNIDFALQRSKRVVEERLQRGPLSFTCLQPVHFADVWLSPIVGFDPLHGQARVFGRGDRPVSWISVSDVARFVVAASEGGRLAGQTLPLGGPEALSALDVIMIFERLGAPEVKVEHVPEQTLKQQLASAKDSIQEAFTAIMLSAARGQVIDPKPALELMPGRLTTVGDYARKIVNRST